MVAEGHTFVITSHSQPVGELRPLRRRRLVNSRIAVEAFRGIPTIERQKFTDDIDAYVSQEIDYER